MSVKFRMPPIKIDREKRRRGKTVPDQSMTIKEIMRRFVKNLPVDVQQKNGIYVDGDVDLEKLSRLDFAEKAAYAADLKAEREAVEAELNERARARKKQQESEKAKQEAERKAPPGPEKSGPDPDVA